eukprot:1994338-Amphidinium_carterae.1
MESTDRATGSQRLLKRVIVLAGCWPQSSQISNGPRTCKSSNQLSPTALPKQNHHLPTQSSSCSPLAARGLVKDVGCNILN